MKGLSILIVTLLLAAPAFVSAQEQAALEVEGGALNQGNYRLGPGDALQITAGPGAERREAIVRTQAIGPGGYINFDLVGSMHVDGMTTDEIDAKLTELLSEYIIDVEVTVVITDYQAKRVFVMGEVRRPGKYLINKHMTIMDAINEAGTTTEDASISKVKLIRSGSAADNTDVQRVNLKKMVQGGELNRNLTLYDGDVIYVPADGLSKWGRFLTKVFRPIQPIVYIGVLTGIWRIAN